MVFPRPYDECEVYAIVNLPESIVIDEDTDKTLSSLKAIALDADEQMVVYSTDGRAAIFSTAQLLPKTTRNTQGVSVMSLKKKAVISDAVRLEDSGIVNQSRYRSRTIPAAGALLKEEDSPEKQASFDI